MAGQCQDKYFGENFPAENRYSSRILPFPHLFNFYLDAAIEEIFQKQQKVTKIVIYADDIAMVLSKSANLDILEKVLSKDNLRINWEKSKQMYWDRNEKIEKVQTLKYLGADVKNSQKPFSVATVRKTKLEPLYNKFKWVPKKHPNTGIKVYNSYFKPVIDFFAERNPRVDDIRTIYLRRLLYLPRGLHKEIVITLPECRRIFKSDKFSLII